MHPASDFQIEIFVQFGAFWLQLPIEIWVILNAFLVWGNTHRRLPAHDAMAIRSRRQVQGLRQRVCAAHAAASGWP